MKQLKDFFEKLLEIATNELDDLLTGIQVHFSVKIIVFLLKKMYQFRIILRPNYWLSYFSFFLFVKLYKYFFGVLIPVYGVFYSLFAPEYVTMPRFHIAYLSLAMGVVAIAVFRWVGKNYPKPVRG